MGDASPRDVAVVLALVAACGATAAPETPPPGWTRVTSGAGDLEVVLPPWMVAFETSGPIFANEVMPDSTPGLQLLAEGSGRGPAGARRVAGGVAGPSS